MKLSRHQSSESGSTEILFPKLETWNPITKVASIVAEVNKNRVMCRVSLNVLQERFGTASEKPMQVIADNRATIQAAARKVIESKTYEKDGSVVIRTVDM